MLRVAWVTNEERNNAFHTKIAIDIQRNIMNMRRLGHSIKGIKITGKIIIGGPKGMA